MTIYEALEKISGYVTDSELPTGIWGNIKDATDYLGKKLSLTPMLYGGSADGTLYGREK